MLLGKWYNYKQMGLVFSPLTKKPMEDETVVVDNSNTTEETTPEVETEEVEEEESSEELKARLAKAEELANNYKARAEKAEKKSKESKETPSEKKDLSSKDIIALMNAKVSEEDVDEVVDYAKFKGISVSEALKSSAIKATLSEKAEQRNIAEATNTKTIRRGTAKLSDDDLVSNASQGKIPESDEDIDRLMKAKLFANRKKG